MTPDRGAKLVLRTGSGVPEVVLAHGVGTSRETVCQYLRHAELWNEQSSAPLAAGYSRSHFSHVHGVPIAGRRRAVCLLVGRLRGWEADWELQGRSVAPYA